MEEDNCKLSDENKTLNIHNEVENNVFIENSNGFTSHQTIQYSSTSLLGE